ncbi:Epsin-2 [Lamellibrachia satsuma]|nr:Epsin-2 [Lamellibrachia satsuma]
MPPIRRSMKNVIKNYSDSQVKVREATSNDPWGPSSTLMSEIADLTYNVVAFTEIMQMVWKRINDHGKNWRHVYKALVLLDYIIKTGSEKVAQQCKENIFAIQTLKDFQYFEEGRDHGMNVREKAKQLVALLKDDERLKAERTKALKAKERFAQNTMGIGSSGQIMVRGSNSPPLQTISEGYRDPYRRDSAASPTLNAELEAVRPSTAGEEELQLQLALAMSKEEHDDEVRRQRTDDIKLQMAVDESCRDVSQSESFPGLSGANHSSASTDPWGTPLNQSVNPDPWTSEPPPYAVVNPEPWGAVAAAAPLEPPVVPSDPWVAGHPTSTPQPASKPSLADPWGAPAPTSATTNGSPWSSPSGSASNGGTNSNKPPGGIDDEFDLLSSRSKSPPNTSGKTEEVSTFDMSGLGASLGSSSVEAREVRLQEHQEARKKAKSPADFLGENASLVNLDNLIDKPPMPAGSTNPFAGANTNGSILGGDGPVPVSRRFDNPFTVQQQQQPRVPLNMMHTSASMGFTQTSGGTMLPAPLVPMSGSGGAGGIPTPLMPPMVAHTSNPFL